MPLVVLSGLTIAGQALWVMILVIAVIATVLLFAFEYFFSTVPAGGLSSGKGLKVALLIALVTVLAFDVGMGGWMLITYLREQAPMSVQELLVAFGVVIAWGPSSGVGGGVGRLL